jgi:hypothetical protein
MRWVVIHEYEVLGGALAYDLLNYPDDGHLPLQEKIPMVEPGIESGAS